MSKPHVNLVTDDPQPRKVLAAVINAHAAAIAQLKKVHQAKEDAHEAWFRGNSAVKAAERALAEARQNEGARLASAALGETTDLLSVADAEAALGAARNDLTVVSNTEQALNQRLDRQSEEVKRAAAAINDAVAAVLGASVPVLEMVKEATQLRDQLMAARARLFFMDSVLPQTSRESASINKFLSHGFLEPEWHGGWQAHPAVQPWTAALAALRTDADAPLPPA